MQIGIRFTAAIGIIAILASGIISAYRHEEIFVICPMASCMMTAQMLQSVGVASWSGGILLIGLFLLGGVAGLLGALLVSILILILPAERYLIWLASLLDCFFALSLSIPLYFIYTDASLGSAFKNVAGSPLAYWYAFLPLVLVVSGMLLLVFSLKSDGVSAAGKK